MAVKDQFDEPTYVEMVDFEDADYHALGMACATLEAAIGAESGIFRAHAARTGQGHAHVVGDALVFALAQKGFVVTRNETQAARVAASYEREPEQAAKLS